VSKKIRIFAGPNGSGKTTLFNRIWEHYHYNIGVFVNADSIESIIKENGKLPFVDFKIEVAQTELIDFFLHSTLAKRAEIDFSDSFEVVDNIFGIKKGSYNSYLAAILAEFIRQKLLTSENTFSTETVMSDPSKIELIKTAREKGFKVYLYYITTDDVRINIERVNSRVQAGGHSVPIEKIKERYTRSLNLLYEGIKNSDRVFLVDSTELPIRLIAEVSEGNVNVKSDRIPNWYIQNIENKILESRNPDAL
jgi:predicted ABC-type ATPase